MANWILGLTGGIGAGKTTVSDYLNKSGICVVDADVVAREVVEPGSEGLNAIVAHFGAQILTDEGTLDRTTLRGIIFADENEKSWLNALLHPLIRAQLLAQLAQADSDYVILSAPLLFENGLEQYCDKTLLVDVPVEVQLTRTCVRDNAHQQQVERIIEAQMSRTDKRAKADFILDNNQPLEAMHTELAALHQAFLQQAEKKRA
ncbi:dephospho-CoA kinase [Pseudoalteromonas ardens]|uniref:Dephospho-CoA kinase n=1 Tax=Pseudoalteromonas rubra TaxID=43658 RepID=A0A0L0ERP3_9GAMM|nr:dephospho-CoA kinase [Pseudoalteromonas sp. R96]KNC67076.1 dephospho-CoA kinase [Pseudoalteromonas rubra]MDK1312597.1 dephospho-CoA kinase [Pseudoalteromonas sp. R96]